MVIYRLLLFRWVPFVYLVTALPAAILVAFLSPPFQRHDEDRQFLQALQRLGGPVPGDAQRFIEAFRPAADHAEMKVDRATIAAARGLTFARGGPPPTPAPEPTAGGGVFDWPVVVGLGLGRATGLGLYASYVLGRIVEACVVVLLGTVAIGMALRGRALLLWLLGLPPVIDLAGTASPDAVMMAGVALAVGLCSRAVGRDAAIGWGWRLVMATIIGLAIATRLTYLPLLALLLTRVAQPERARSTFDSFLVAVGPFCLAVAIILGSILAEGAATHLSFATLAGLSLQAEADWLRQALPGLTDKLGDMLTQAGTNDIEALAGLFATPPVMAFAIAWALAFVAAAGLAFVEEGDAPPFGMGVTMLFWGALAAVATLVAASIGGGSNTLAQQAGLLLPLAPLAALVVPGLIVPRWNRAYSGFGTVFAFLGWFMIFALTAVSAWLVLPPVLLQRFYL